MIKEIFEVLLFLSSFFTSLWIILQIFYYRISYDNYYIGNSSSFNNEMRKKKIDIIVAIRNENEKTIKELVDNLSNLDYEHYRVIVVSDDTEDNFKKIIDAIGKIPENFIIVRREKNYGRKAGALNFALTLSNADLVVFLDAEARVERDFLNKVSQLEYDAMAFRLKIRNPITPIQKIYAITNEFVMNSLFKARQKLGLLIFANGSALAIKRDILLKVGKWKENRVTEDLELGIRLALNSIRVNYIDNIIVYTLAPYDIVDLYNQIKRWAYGSAELLIYSLNLFKLGIKGIEGFIYVQQWGIYPLYLLMIILILSFQFLLNINYIYIVISLLPIVVTNGFYIALVNPKGDYRSGLVTIMASLIGYLEGVFKIRFEWKVTPKSYVQKEEEITSIKILGLVLGVFAYINSIFSNTLASFLLILISMALLLV
ncbi:glycosyltransferase family 2 protein [Sulfolobus tengchongensis]|uniref:Glycosyltransferase family 2 protein n=1 Tax=Sulfolobus tengchongensis TaxID=207809 RepID=A0AAX4L549_9CREN